MKDPEKQQPQKLYSDTEIDRAWYVGAMIGKDDMTDTFVSEGRWENGYNDRYISEVQSIKVGEKIVIKSTSNMKKNLPFENNGEFVGFALIKAIGTVNDNPGDGRHLKVDWVKLDNPKRWYYFTGFIRETVNLVKASEDPSNKELLDFTFLDKEQDYSRFEGKYSKKQEDEEIPESEEISKPEDEPSPDNERLVGILKKWLNELPIEGNKVSTIIAFGIKYGAELEESKLDSGKLLDLANESTSLGAYMDHGRDICKAMRSDAFKSYYSAALPQRKSTKGDRKHPLNCILYGAPGTGKTYFTPQYATAVIENEDIEKVKTETRAKVIERYNEYITNNRIVFTTFHQSYGYEDFIQGIRPDTSKDGVLAFKPVDGIFKLIADRAMNDPENRYVIIIDEINRANISKVFGELITLIEDDKRWGESEQTCAALPSGDRFAVPNNLYIVGTMNTADKSISLIDTALRRRFDFVEMYPDPNLIEDKALKAVLASLNAKLAKELGSSDLLIGHAYFIGKTEKDLIDIMNRKIIPLLYEYFYDNTKKVKAVAEKALEGTDYSVIDEKTSRLRIKKKDQNK